MLRSQERGISEIKQWKILKGSQNRDPETVQRWPVCHNAGCLYLILKLNIKADKLSINEDERNKF